MKLKFDVVISDITTPLPYEERTIRESPLGGTEASVIRLAELLAKKGHSVAVLIHNQAYKLQGAKHASGITAFYLPLQFIESVEPRNYIALRSAYAFDAFPDARKVSWHEDVWAKPANQGLVDKIKESKATVVAVSQWHKSDIESQNLGLTVEYAYNICPEEIYNAPRNNAFDKNSMCWIASPHKGLEKGLELFEEVKKKVPSMTLSLFNPGYLSYRIRHMRGVINHGPKPAPVVWQHMQNSLCTFYPTEFLETFGCIAAESNALGVPIATNAIGALNETVSSKDQLSGAGNLQDVVDLVVNWHTNGRPEVLGQDRFREDEVYKQWKKILHL